MDFIDKSYKLQAASEEEMALPSRYTAPDSIDNWRHTRMLDSLAPLIESNRGAAWITVGDGRFGSDAAYLHSKQVAVTATTLTDERLSVAFEKGYIPAYQSENAEKLSFADNSVDFVLCKEAYHHFPRPPVALYEMLRVACEAVVLIEPVDNPRILDFGKKLAKRLIRGDWGVQFEPSGNFLYRVSLREMEKLMTAMGLHTIAFKGINDFYHPRLGSYDARTFNFGSAVSRAGIATQDVLSACGLLGYGLACIVLFKGVPEPDQLDALRKSGFKVIALPENPYGQEP